MLCPVHSSALLYICVMKPKTLWIRNALKVHLKNIIQCSVIISIYLVYLQKLCCTNVHWKQKPLQHAWIRTGRFLVEDAVKVAFRVPGTLLSCHIQPPWGEFEGIWDLWDVFLSPWKKFSSACCYVGLHILNDAAGWWFLNPGRQGNNWYSSATDIATYYISH